jgi:hypothetical protein
MSIPSPDPRRAAVPGPAPSPLPGVPGVPDHSTLSGEDLARSLLSPDGGLPSGPAAVGDLPTLQGILDKARAMRNDLGLSPLDDRPEKTLVAVTTVTDLEKDRALCEGLSRHPEIKTVKPEVLTRLGDMSSGLSAVDQAVTPVSASLLQATVEFDDEFSALCDRVQTLLDQPPETPISGDLTVRGGQILLSEFLRVSELQTNQETARATQSKRTQNRVASQVAGQEQALADQESVRRLQQAARDNAALPAPTPAPTKKRKTAGATKKPAKKSGAKAKAKAKKPKAPKKAKKPAARKSSRKPATPKPTQH